MERSSKRLAMFGLLPFAAATAAWFQPARPHSIAAPAPRPALAFRRFSINLGDVSAVPVVGANFDFSNRSDRPVHILSLTPSCGCLQTRVFDRQMDYRAGAFGRFQVSLATANEDPGPHEYSIRVAYDDGQPREQIIHFSVTLPEITVRVEPSELYVYKFSDETESKVVNVIDRRERPLQVVEARLMIGAEPCPAELAQVVIQSAEAAEHGVQIPVRIDVGRVEHDARIAAHLVITTDDPEFQTLKIPTLLWGRPRGIVPASAEAPESQPR